MNEMTVGMENLPNVFIERIDLYPMRPPNTRGIDRYRTQVKLYMYDHSPKRSWHGRTGLSDLSIKVVFRGGKPADALNDGSESLYDYAPSDALVEIINQSDFSIESELNGYTKFSTIIERELPAIDNLNVYAACFIGDLEFGNDLFNKFYGPMSAEKIFVGGVVSDQSGYFYHPDSNEEYGGPVHGQQGTYMEGSEHIAQRHATLRYVVEENYKIRSFPTSIGLRGDSSSTQSRSSPENPNGPQSGQGNIIAELERRKLEESIDSIEENLPNDIAEEIY